MKNLKHLFIKVIVMKNGLKLVKTRGLTTSYIYPSAGIIINDKPLYHFAPLTMGIQVY